MTVVREALQMRRLLALVREHVQHEVAHPGRVEGADRRRHVRRFPQRAVALGRAREIHGVTDAEELRGEFEGALAVLVEPDEVQMRRAEAVQGAAGIGRGGGDGFQRAAVAIGVDDVGHPAVREPACAPERGVGAAAAPDRRAARLRRRRFDRDFGEGIEASLMGDRPARPQFAQHADALAEPRAALFHRHAAKLELDRELAADADAEDHPALRHPIEGRNLLRHRRGMAQRQQVDRGADTEPVAQRRRLRELY